MVTLQNITTHFFFSIDFFVDCIDLKHCTHKARLIITGWPKSRTKLRFGGLRNFFFHFSADSLQFQNSKSLLALSTYSFRVIAISKFGLGSPCTTTYIWRKSPTYTRVLIYNLEKFIFSCWIIAPMGKMKTKGLAQEEKNTGQNLKQKFRINFAITMNTFQS